jgi:hypothetical protein
MPDQYLNDQTENDSEKLNPEEEISFIIQDTVCFRVTMVPHSWSEM